MSLAVLILPAVSAYSSLYQWVGIPISDPHMVDQGQVVQTGIDQLVPPYSQCRGSCQCHLKVGFRPLGEIRPDI